SPGLAADERLDLEFTRGVNAVVASNLRRYTGGEVGERKRYERPASTAGLEQEEPLRVGHIAPDLNPTARRPRCWSDRVSGSGAACRRDRSVPLPAFHTLAPALIDEAVELAQANQFGFEQTPERTELHRVVLAQHFGRGGELDRIGPPGVVSEPGFDLFDLLAGPQERTGFDAFGRPIFFRTAYDVGRSVHRFSVR